MKDGELLAEDRAFGANLRRTRERHGLSQERLAELMQEEDIAFHQQTLTRIENGRQPVRLGEAMRLALVLGTSVEALLDPEISGHEADRISGATRDVERAREAMIRAAARHSRSRRALEAAVASAEDRGLADSLAAEISAARRALRRGAAE